MYAYCGNNPTIRMDESGEGWGLVTICVIGIIAIFAADHYLAKNHPKGLAAHDDQKEIGFSERGLYATGSGFKIDQNELTLVDFEAGIYDGTTKYKNSEISLMQLGQVEATAKVDYSGVPSLDISAQASAYTMDGSHKFRCFGLEINISGALHVGYLGVGVAFDPEEGEFGVSSPTIGLGGSFVIDIDYY